MNKFFLVMITLALPMAPSQANPVPRRATITGAGGNGRCTIEVNVDGAAEIEIAGDTGLLTTISGQPAVWRRFQCNAPLPRIPIDFRFVKIDGKGTVRLLQDPRSSNGRAVIHINDYKGGRGNYAFDFQWRGSGGGGGGGGWPPGPPGPQPMVRAIRACQDSVTDRLSHDGYQYINFGRTIPDDNPGITIGLPGQ